MVTCVQHSCPEAAGSNCGCQGGLACHVSMLTCCSRHVLREGRPCAYLCMFNLGQWAAPAQVTFLVQCFWSTLSACTAERVILHHVPEVMGA